MDQDGVSGVMRSRCILTARSERDGEGYLPLQQQQPPQSSPLQQHFSQQQNSPQQSQHAPAAAGLAGAGLPPKNGKTVRTMDDNFMTGG